MKWPDFLHSGTNLYKLKVDQKIGGYSQIKVWPV